MKRVLISLIALSVSAVMAQDAPVQSGTPAKLTVRGKVINVFLQGLEDGTLTFQVAKNPKNIPAPANKVTSLQFFPKFDEEAVLAAYASGDYDSMLSTLEPVMSEYLQYMVIDNNMRDEFDIMYNAYRSQENFAKVKEYADIMIAIGDEDLVIRAKVGKALASISDGDIEAAEAVVAELDDDAAKLYLTACIQRAQGDPVQAIQTVTTIISEHPNDMIWLPQGELLNAYLYLDMTGTNSVISTNSAMYTARQVKNMYKGNNVAADAEILWDSLGGRAVEEAEAKERAEMKAREEKRKAEAKARREKEAEERKARKAAEKKAAEEAAAAAAKTNTVETATN
jgi:hypothetical protein